MGLQWWRLSGVYYPGLIEASSGWVGGGTAKVYPGFITLSAYQERSAGTSDLLAEVKQDGEGKWRRAGNRQRR